jgi:hypothetical protein
LSKLMGSGTQAVINYINNNRFGKYARVEAVQLVLVVIGCCQHYHRNTSNPLVLFYCLQEFDAVHDGHVQVKQNETGLVAALILEVI